MFYPEFIFLPILCFFQILIPLVFLAYFIFYLWMIIDIVQGKFAKEDDKTMWLLIVILVPVGCVLYYFIEKKKHN